MQVPSGYSIEWFKFWDEIKNIFFEIGRRMREICRRIFNCRYDYPLSSYGTLANSDWSSMNASSGGTPLLPPYPASLTSPDTSTPNHPTSSTPSSLNLVNAYMKAPISPLSSGEHGNDGEMSPSSNVTPSLADYGAYQYGISSAGTPDHGECFFYNNFNLSSTNSVWPSFGGNRSQNNYIIIFARIFLGTLFWYLKKYFLRPQ